MKIEVVCYGMMRDYLPAGSSGNRAALDISPGSTVAHVVDALGAPRAAVFAVLIDGEQAKLDDELSEGAEVTLMPPFTGGADARS